MTKKLYEPAQKIRDYIDVFSTEQGQRVLGDLEDRCYSNIRIDQRPEPGYPNEAFLNPNAALYRAGMVDQVQRIKRILNKRGELDDYTKNNPKITDL